MAEILEAFSEEPEPYSIYAGKMPALPRTMDAIDIAWLAGLVEGEGCVSLVGDATVSIKVAMTDEDVVRRCKELTGSGTIRGPLPPTWGGTKPIWIWETSYNGDVARILLALYPLLGERRQGRVAEAAEHLGKRKRKVPRARMNSQPCGTWAKYFWHKRHDEPPCRACKDEFNRVHNERRRRKRERERGAT